MFNSCALSGLDFFYHQIHRASPCANILSPFRAISADVLCREEVLFTEEECDID